MMPEIPKIIRNSRKDDYCCTGLSGLVKSDMKLISHCFYSVFLGYFVVAIVSLSSSQAFALGLSTDLIGPLSNTLNISKPQAKGGTGALLQLAGQNLSASDLVNSSQLFPTHPHC